MKGNRLIISYQIHKHTESRNETVQDQDRDIKQVREWEAAADMFVVRCSLPLLPSCLLSPNVRKTIGFGRGQWLLGCPYAWTIARSAASQRCVGKMRCNHHLASCSVPIWHTNVRASQDGNSAVLPYVDKLVNL